MTLLFTDPIYLQHETGRHPERAARLESISRVLAKSGLAARCEKGKIAPIPEESLADVHDARQVMVKQFAQHGGGAIDPDTVTSVASFDVALHAAGACVAAVDAVVGGTSPNALCLVRPPGHHATPTQSMGFCLFNNVALAARRARANHGLNRVLIVDWDVHHGNGTQDVFYEDSEVFFLSIHRYGNGFYPGTGAANETGRGKGLGTTLNLPVKFGTSRKDYLDQTAKVLQQTVDRFKPELVLVSAGFDAHRLDPVGSLGLEVEDFGTLTRQVLDVAKTHARGRLVSCLEGGYHLQALAESVQVHLETLLAFEP